MLLAYLMGLLTIAAFLAIPFTPVPTSQATAPMWIVPYLLVSTIALYMWHNLGDLTSVKDWFMVAAGSCLLGAVFFGVDVLMGHSHYPDLPLLEAGTKAGISFLATLIVCPVLTVIALAGAVRSGF